MAIKFGKIFAKIREVLISKSSLLSNIKSCIGSCNRRLKPKLESLDTIDQVIDVIRDQCTLARFPLLNAVIEICKLTEAKAILNAYNKELDEFYKKFNINIWIAHNKSLQVTKTPRPLPSEKIVFTLSWEPNEYDDYTYEDIEQLLKQFFDKQYERWVNVIVIKPDNSIVVVCTFPPHLFHVLVTKAQENIEVVKMKTIKLAIGHFTVWNKYERDQVIDNNCRLISNNCTIGSDRVREGS